MYHEITFSLMADSRCLTTLFSDSVFVSPFIFAESVLTDALATLIVDDPSPSRDTVVILMEEGSFSSTSGSEIY